MGLGKALTTALDGVIAHIVTVEANVGAGLPGIQIVGMADTGISEARSRIRTAVLNSHLPWPKTKIIVSLAPASLPKSGPHYDLPVALAVLVAGLTGMGTPDNALTGGFGGSDAGGLDAEIVRRLDSSLFLGELGLDGSVRAVPGVIPALVTARQVGKEFVIIPPGNAAEAALVPDMKVLVAPTLSDAFAWVCGRRMLPRAAQFTARGTRVEPAPAPEPCLSDIAGQHEAKHAAEVAAAGGHHMLMVGPPGAGKSMIASRLPSILPRLTTEQAVEATAIHSIVGSPGRVIDRAPFVAPHASITRAALLGGGSGIARPGAVSLAHHGVLFLDEASEVSAGVLDGLRAPLEEGQVRLVRSRREVMYPARFQLVLAANLCRCGAEDSSACRCTSTERLHYLSNLSGPLRDRLDMFITVSGQSARLSVSGEETSAVVAGRVAAARERSAHRWGRAGLPFMTNAAVGSALLRRDFPAEEQAMELLAAYLATGSLSQRGVDRTLRLSWTLADLAGVERPSVDEVSRALDLRGASAGVAEKVMA